MYPPHSFIGGKKMITNTINLVELVAEEGKKLTDKERTATFSKIMVRLDNVDDYEEITEEEAQEIENKLLDRLLESVEEIVSEEGVIPVEELVDSEEVG